MASPDAPCFTANEAAALLPPDVCEALASGLEPPPTLGGAIRRLTDFRADPSTKYTDNHSEFDDMRVIHETTTQVLHLLLEAEREQMAEAQKKLQATKKTARAQEENLAQLTTQMSQLMTVQMQMQSDLLEMHKNAAAKSAAASEAAAPARDHWINPGAFAGTPSEANTDTAAEYRIWRDRVTLRVKEDAASFPDERRKMLFAVTNMKGDAAELTSHFWRQLVDGGEAESWDFLRFSDLMAYLDKVYDSGDDLVRCHQDLEALNMSKFPNFHQFLGKFATLATRTGLDDAAKVTKLHAKVSNRLRRAGSTVFPRPSPDDYTAWVRVYTDMYLGARTADIAAISSHPLKTSGPARHAPANPSRPPVFATSNYTTGLQGEQLPPGDPMVLGKMTDSRRPAASGAADGASNTRMPRMSTDAFQKCLTENLCFICRGEGHRAFTCPQRRRPSGSIARAVKNQKRKSGGNSVHFKKLELRHDSDSSAFNSEEEESEN